MRASPYPLLKINFSYLPYIFYDRITELPIEQFRNYFQRAEIFRLQVLESFGTETYI